MKSLLDVGCNDLAGFRLLSTMESLQDRRKVFVEANPECWEDLEKDISNIPNGILVKKAVSFDNNPVSLVTRKDELKCTGATIMGDEFFKDSLGRWGIVADSTYHTVPAITLMQLIVENQIFTPECILKLDAEGIEYKLLEWIFGQGILFEKIYCEFHVHNSDDQQKKDQLIGKLKSRNYQIFEWH